MKRWMKVLFLIALLGLSRLIAQEFRASLSGQVLDPSGATISGCTITAANVATGVRVTTKSGADGYYMLTRLPPGAYDLSAEATGFRAYTRRGITLNIGDKANADIRMEIGALADSVTVTAELTGVESNQSVMGQLMDNQKVSELPLNGRSFITLLQFSSGVIFTTQVFGSAGWTGTRQFETGPSAGAFTMHGSRPSTNAFLLDGAPQGVEGGVSYTPLIDGVEEMKVVAPTSDASYGLSGGAVVNVTMKSGTNQFHGVLSEFLRNNVFDANFTQTNRAAAARPDLKKNQHQWNNFSGLLSGPIIKNKLFFSANYDGFRERVPQPVTSTLPTLPQRAGDFSQTFNGSGGLVVIYDPLTTRQVGNNFVRDPIAGNRIPDQRMSPIARNILKYVPAPNLVTDPITNINNFAASPNVGRYGYDSYYIKADYVWSQNQRTFVSGTQNRGHEFNSYNGLPFMNPAKTGDDPYKRDHAAATLDHVYAISPTTVLNARLSWDRWVDSSRKDSIDNFDGSQLGFKNQIGSSPVTRFPSISFTTYSPYGGGGSGFNPNMVYTAVADVSKSVNRHMLKFGTRMAVNRYNRRSTGNWYGSFSFDTSFTQRDPLRADDTSGNSMAAFLLGYPSGGSTDVNAQSSYQDKTFSFYFQDDFKVNSKLTLNYGLRWDIQTAPTERYDRRIRTFDPQVSYTLGSAQATGGLVFPDSNHRQSWSTHYHDLQPRVGIAYQVSPKLVWRSGYGMSFLPANGTGGGGTIIQTGFSRSTPLAATLGGGVNAYIPNLPGAGTFDTPYPNGILQPFGASLGPKTNVGQSITFQNPGYEIPRVHLFHFGLDYEFAPGFTAEVSYVGSRTRKYPATKTLNAISLNDRLQGFATPTYLTTAVPNPFAGAPELVGSSLGSATLSRSQALLPFPQFTSVSRSLNSIGNSSYNSLEIRVNRRLAHGLSMTGSYTFAKYMEAVAFREPQYTTLYHVLTNFDRPHHLTVYALYQLPIGRGRSLGHNWPRALDLALGNWQYNVTYEYMKGTPTPLPDATPVGDPRLPDGQQSFSRWFNTCTLLSNGNRSHCASPDEPIAWMQLKPNELRTYSTYFPNLRNHWRPNINTSLFKLFPITERLNLELRAEAFNALNSPIYGGPNTSVTSGNFGLVVPDQINFPRGMQFALRLKF